MRTRNFQCVKFTDNAAERKNKEQNFAHCQSRANICGANALCVKFTDKAAEIFLLRKNPPRQKKKLVATGN